MEQDLVHKVLGNVRHPLDYKTRIKFTARAIMFIVEIYKHKNIDVIELNSTMLRLAHSVGCLDDSSIPITMNQSAVYLLYNPGTSLSIEDVRGMADKLDPDRDNDYREVEDTITLLS